MAINESELQLIVSEVVKKIKEQETAPTTQLGIFNDMNTAIAAAKDAQKIMQKMPMDFREKIIKNIRRKTKENAELLAKMGVEETGMGNVGDKILKHHLHNLLRFFCCRNRIIHVIENT